MDTPLPLTSHTLDRTSLLLDWFVLLIKAFVSIEVSWSLLHHLHFTHPCVTSTPPATSSSTPSPLLHLCTASPPLTSPHQPAQPSGSFLPSLLLGPLCLRQPSKEAYLGKSMILHPGWVSIDNVASPWCQLSQHIPLLSLTATEEISSVLCMHMHVVKAIESLQIPSECMRVHYQPFPVTSEESLRDSKPPDIFLMGTRAPRQETS